MIKLYIIAYLKVTLILASVLSDNKVNTKMTSLIYFLVKNCRIFSLQETFVMQEFCDFRHYFVNSDT